MIELDIQTWASAAAVIAAVVALMTLMNRRFDKVDVRIDKVESTLGNRIDKVESTLGNRIEQVRQEAKADNEATRTEMRQRFGEVRDELSDIRASLRALEQRFFELLLPRRPAPTGTEDT